MVAIPADDLSIEFDIHDSITGLYMGTLDFDSWAFNDPLVGVGTFTGSIPLRPEQGVLIRSITEPWGYALYARYGETYLWGGPLTTRSWKRTDGTLTIEAMQWEGWLYQRLLQAKYVRLNADQFSICRSLVTLAITDLGCPPITLISQPASIIRDLTVDPWTSYGEAIDRLASRDPGFDWSIQIRKHKTTGNPELYLALWYPERKSIFDPKLMFESTFGESEDESGGNAEVDEWPDDSANIVSRMWATGEGQPPDQPSASDADPALDDFGGKTVLLTEAVTNWSGVTVRTTLQDHAKRERKARGVSIQTVPVNVSPFDPDVRDYMTGDRVRFVCKDRWVDVDYPGVRILDRAIRGSRSAGQSVTLVLDLNDYEAPDSGEGVDA